MNVVYSASVQSSRNSSCTDACVQIGVNYSATYGTAPTTPSMHRGPSTPAVLTLAANSSNAGSLMNDSVGVRKSFDRCVFDSALHSVHAVRSVSRLQVDCRSRGQMNLARHHSSENLSRITVNH